MRHGLLGLAIAGGLLAQGGAVAAQDSLRAMMPNQQAPVEAHGQYTGHTPLPTQHERYAMKLASLRDRTIRTRAKDGGQLSPEHAAALQHELDGLNHQFKITG